MTRIQMNKSEQIRHYLTTTENYSSRYSTSCWEESLTGDEYLDYLDRREAEKNGW